MRIWSLHPRYLDAKGLVALWRETLLAQNVLAGNTKGYKNHPQLNRFKQTRNSLGAIATYLRAIQSEADKRGYNFDKSKINSGSLRRKITVTSGQLDYEYQHLCKKLEVRDTEKLQFLQTVKTLETHPMFEIILGKVEPWEVI